MENNNLEEFNNSYLEYKKSIENKTDHKKLPIFNKRFKVYNPDQIFCIMQDIYL